MATKTKKPRFNKIMTITAKPRVLSAPDQNVGADEISLYLDFGTPEELERDTAEWRSIVANTTDEQLDELERRFIEEEKQTGSVPLDFKDRQKASDPPCDAWLNIIGMFDRDAIVARIFEETQRIRQEHPLV